MTFAFSRDGAVPGHNLWRKLGKNKTPTWAVVFVATAALIITIPAYKGNHAGLPVAFLAVTSISVIGLYIAYIIPVYLRWRMRDKFEPGPWTLGAKYKWINLIAIVWVALCVIIFSLPFTPAAVPFSSSFSWSAFNYAPLITIVVIGRGDDLVLHIGAQDVQGPNPDGRRRRPTAARSTSRLSPAAS